MPLDLDLVARLREQLEGRGLAEKGMFGGRAFLLGGHLAVGASHEGGLMVRCDPAETEHHYTTGAQPFEMRGRAMPGWLRVPADAVADDEVLAHWVQVGTSYAGSLPPK